jgi:ParB-like chromosome segregation protein Spo0J
MKIEQIVLDELIPYANNARTHSEEQVLQIASSIKEFGFNAPVLIDKDKGIIAGHGRVMAAKKLGLKEAPCIRLEHLTEAQKKAYILADNRIAMNSEWDEQMLGLEIMNLKDDGFDIDNLGFSELEIKEFLKQIDEVDLPDLPIGDKEPFQQMTFILHDQQAEQVKAAIEKAKKMGPFDSENENPNGNAIARICETFNGIS